MDSMSEGTNFSIGQRVEVAGREVSGSVAFIGTTSFAPGKWIGLILDEPKGKNNGSFQGTVYFEAPENHGLFVRQAQLILLEGEGGVTTTSGKKTLIPGPAAKTTPPKPSPEESKTAKQNRSRISGFGFFTTLAPVKSSFSPRKAADATCTSSSSSTTPTSSTSRDVQDFSSKSPFKSPSKYSVGKLKEKLTFFSKLPKPPAALPTTSLPGPSKSFSGIPDIPLNQPFHVPRSGTFSGSFSSTNSRNSLVGRSEAPLKDPKNKNSSSPSSSITPARSSPHINSIPTVTSIPFPSFNNIVRSNSPTFRSLGSGLESPSGVVCCHHVGRGRGSASQGDLTHVSSGYVSIRGCTTTPPKKPPRPSLSKTPITSKSGLCSPAATTNLVDVTPPPPPPSPTKADGGYRSVEGGLDVLTTNPSSNLVGIYSKRRTRISSEAGHGPTPATTASTSRGAHHRICRKLGETPEIVSSDSVTGSGITLSGIPQSIVDDTSLIVPGKSKQISRLVQPNFSMRLPIAGTNTKETPSAKSLQTSPSTSKSDLRTPTGVTAKTDPKLDSKRQSFIETIAEPIVPQYTQGPLYTPTMTPSNGGPHGEDRFGTLQNLESLRHEVKDLHEKLEVLKGKRAADQDKLREIDRLKLQVETLAEFKTKVLENQSSLQKELKKAKQDARDAISAKDQHAEEMAELSEAVEMATLDKEMAEEKAETLQLELEQANEKIAQLSTELTAIKDELTGNIDPSLQAANSVQMKQLVGENARMREALLKLRDSSTNDKHQLQKVLKEAEIHKAEAFELSKGKERLEKRCDELEVQISELQEMNDAALGAEEMVVNLTEKNLNLEEKVSQLAEAVADLEALQDVNEQLQESAREAEMEVRDELHRAVVANANTVREKEALIETLGDREMTIARFRELVQKLRDENDILRKNLEEESSKSILVLPEALDFKKIFAETKAQTTAIDLELRRIEAKEAALHANYLSSFMPEGFMKRGGDNDALLVLLLVPRMICKVELLLSQIRDKLTPASFADGMQNGDEIATFPDVERYAFSCQFSYLLHALLSELHRWSTALNTCSTDDFLKVGLLYSDLSVKEKAVDFYLELLRKSQLDENISLEGLEKCITSFQSFYSIHLGEELLVHSTLVSDLCLTSAAASDCLLVDVARLIQLLNKSERGSDMGALLQDIRTIGESLRQLAKRTRRYLPDPPKQPPVSTKLQSQLLNDAIALTKVVKVFQDASKQAVHHAVMAAGNEGENIPSHKLEEYFQYALEKCETRIEGAVGYKEVIKDWLTTALMTMTDLAQVVNEAPVMPKEPPPTPLSLRSEAVKAELDQSRNLRLQLELKETAINELRKIVRSKQEELSEATIRKELAEKKLSNATKDSEMSIEKLNRKLEDALLNHQRKEREFQATMEHFQAEIDLIESEKGELKEKLMSASKRRLLEGIAQSAANSPISSPAHGVLQTVTPVQSVIASEVAPTPGLMEYTRFLQRENWKLKSQKVLNIFKRLKPIDLPKKEDIEAVRQLEKDYWKLKHESNTLLCESLKVALNKELSPARKQYLLLTITSRKSELSTKMIDLKSRIDSLMSHRKETEMIRADFANFSPELSKQEADADAVKVGMIRFPGWEKSTDKPRRIVLSREQLHRIHSLLVTI